jgi:hypothetical protein
MQIFKNFHPVLNKGKQNINETPQRKAEGTAPHFLNLDNTLEESISFTSWPLCFQRKVNAGWVGYRANRTGLRHKKHSN